MSNMNVRVFRDGIYGGLLSHIRVVDKHDEIEADVLDTSLTKKVVALNIRKIGFQKIDEYVGQDLFYRLGFDNPYDYKITMPVQLHNNLERSEVYQHNTLIIRHVRPFGAILSYAGFQREISASELKEIKKILMRDDDILSIRAHEVELSLEGIANISNDNVTNINEQAASLKYFRDIALPTKPQKIEKVYAKYFK